MTEGISDEKLIKDLQELESSLWGTLLEKQRFDCWNDVSSLIQNPVYMAAHQRVEKTDLFDPEQSWEDEQITSLYDRINQMVEAIPAIQTMQSLGDLGRSKRYFDNSVPPEIQESVQAVLERARSKLYDVRTEYASFGEASGDQAGPTDEERQSNQRLGLQLRELLTLLPAASLPTGAKQPPLEIVRLISANPRATTPEEPSRRSDAVLEGMRQVAAQAAGAFSSAVQTFKNLIGMGKDHTQ